MRWPIDGAQCPLRLSSVGVEHTFRPVFFMCMQENGGLE